MLVKPEVAAGAVAVDTAVVTVVAEAAGVDTPAVADTAAVVAAAMGAIAVVVVTAVAVAAEIVVETATVIATVVTGAVDVAGTATTIIDSGPSLRKRSNRHDLRHARQGVIEGRRKLLARFREISLGRFGV